MKYEVIGWTYYDSDYQDAFDDNNYYAVKIAVIDSIRKNALSFDWEYHHFGRAGAPVLNSGKICRFSAREWCNIMGEAWFLDPYLYFLKRTSMRPPELRKRCPNAFVDKSKILKAGCVFDTSLPIGYKTSEKDFDGKTYEAIKESVQTLLKPYKEKAEEEERKKDFYRAMRAKNEEKKAKTERETEEAKNAPLSIKMTLVDDAFYKIKNGIKTVEVRLNDKKRRRLKEGCYIRFVRYKHKEDELKVQVVGLYKFKSFKALFSSELFSKTGFGDYTAEDATKKMYEYYDKADELKYGVLGIEIKVLTK